MIRALGTTMPAHAHASQGRRAGVVTRVVANVVDLGIVLAGLFGAYLAMAGVRYLVDPLGFRLRVPPAGVSAVLAIGLQIVYFTVSWTTTGRTVGDRLLGLRVVNGRGELMRTSVIYDWTFRTPPREDRSATVAA